MPETHFENDISRLCEIAEQVTAGTPLTDFTLTEAEQAFVTGYTVRCLEIILTERSDGA